MCRCGAKRLLSALLALVLLAAAAPRAAAADAALSSRELRLVSNVAGRENLTWQSWLGDGVLYMDVELVAELTRAQVQRQSGHWLLEQGSRRIELGAGEEPYLQEFARFPLNAVERDGALLVEALPLLTYLGADCSLAGGTLYCAMPDATLWEAGEDPASPLEPQAWTLLASQDLSRVHPYDLESRGTVRAALTVDLLGDLLAGGLPAAGLEDNCDRVIAEALDVNPFIPARFTLNRVWRYTDVRLGNLELLDLPEDGASLAETAVALPGVAAGLEPSAAERLHGALADPGRYAATAALCREIGDAAAELSERGGDIALLRGGYGAAYACAVAVKAVQDRPLLAGVLAADGEADGPWARAAPAAGERLAGGAPSPDRVLALAADEGYDLPAGEVDSAARPGSLAAALYGELAEPAAREGAELPAGTRAVYLVVLQHKLSRLCDELDRQARAENHADPATLDSLRAARILQNRATLAFTGLIADALEQQPASDRRDAWIQFYSRRDENTGEALYKLTVAKPAAPLPFDALGGRRVELPQTELDRLLGAVRDAAGGPVQGHILTDLDGDGRDELFAAVGDYSYHSESGHYYHVEVWYADAGGARMLREADGYVNSGRIIEAGETRFFAIDRYYAVMRGTCTWGVRGGAPYETGIAAVGYVWTDDDGALWIEESTTDGANDPDGGTVVRTWKPYPLYVRDGEIREYGGIEITLDQLLAQRGAAEILGDQIDAVTTIYYRANGLIHVNCSAGSNWNLTLRWQNGAVELVDTGSGIYSAAYLEELADYPSAPFR